MVVGSNGKRKRERMAVLPLLTEVLLLPVLGAFGKLELEIELGFPKIEAFCP